MALPPACPVPGCMQRLPCYIHDIQHWSCNDMTADELREAREDDAVTLATLRAENERLREVLSRIAVTLCVYESGSTVCGTVYPQCSPCLARARAEGRGDVKLTNEQRRVLLALSETPKGMSYAQQGLVRGAYMKTWRNLAAIGLVRFDQEVPTPSSIVEITDAGRAALGGGK